MSEMKCARCHESIGGWGHNRKDGTICSDCRVRELVSDNTRLRQEIADLRGDLARVVKVASRYLYLYEGVYDMAVPNVHQSDEARRTEEELRAVLSDTPKPLAVVEVSICEKCGAVNPSDFDLNLGMSMGVTHEGDRESCGGVLVTGTAIVLKKDVE